jgi:plasmid maintenance system antidote protein VapI
MPIFKAADLRWALDTAGLTDVEAARLAGVSRDTIRSARCGRKVTARTAVRILEMLSRRPPVPGVELLARDHRAEVAANG